MLVIRMQRTGRKGHAMFRVVVQDSRRTPSSGKIVAFLGSYDPHTKALTLNKERAQHYLDHGAQPSDRIAVLLKAEGVKLPAWVKLSAGKERKVRNPDKRRSTRPEEPVSEEPAETETSTEANEPEAGDTSPSEEPTEAESAESATTETTTEATSETTPEAPAEAEATEAAADESPEA